MSNSTSVVLVTPDYASITAVADICEPWIELWGGSEWGEVMHSLRGACHTSYGFSDEDCALFASKLIENLISQKGWMDEEGMSYGIQGSPEEIESVREECRRLRKYWLNGGNLANEPHKSIAKETLDSMPAWLFEGGHDAFSTEEDVEGLGLA